MNVVVFDIGALRADHLGCYGYTRPTSPALDAVAACGVRYTAAFSSDAATAAARAALFSGRFGLETGVVTDGAAQDAIAGHTPVSVQGLAAPRPMLAEYLSAQGIHTAAISPLGRQPARWFYHGWREVLDPWCGKEPGEVTAADVNLLARPWLAAHAAHEFFLYLSYNNLYQRADTPLTAREAEYSRCLAGHGGPAAPDATTFAGHAELHAAFSARVHPAPTREAAWKLVHDYDARIRVLDDAVAEIVAVLRATDMLARTILIVTSDHGVLFGECGCYGGHISAHYQCVRVPLLIAAPGWGVPGNTCAGLCYTLDLAPTICRACGVCVPAGFAGQALQQITEQASGAPRDFVVCSHGHFTAQRALICNEWKLNRTWHAGFWDFPDTALYHLAEDAGEGHDCAAGEPQRVVALLRKLRQWTEEYSGSHADPLARVACDEPPGFLRYGQELRARVRRGELRTPAQYRGRWA
jgi:arylsulfatase A-like enzyme